MQFYLEWEREIPGLGLQQSASTIKVETLKELHEYMDSMKEAGVVYTKLVQE